MPIADFAPRYLKRSVKKTASPAEKKKKKPELSADEFCKLIQLKAYELYEQRGCVSGFDVEDWVKAEGLVSSQYEKSAS